MSVFFTSDLHLGHKLVSEKRGFKTINDHDEAVLSSLTKVANKRTVIWVLGDIGTKDGVSRLKEVAGRKNLVFGNHDDLKIDYSDVFDKVFGIVKYKNMWLSHCPIHPQEMYRCVANVHGHIHKNSNSELLGFPYINVNWDYWNRPLTLDELKLIIKSNIEVL